MRLALCQTNPTVGDLAGNVKGILEFARRAAEAGADLAVFPELAVCGYPPLDLLESRAFLDDVEAAVAHLARQAPIPLLVGAPVRNDAAHGKPLFNSALLLDGGRVAEAVHKVLLPTYDVFDEARYFEPGGPCRALDFRGARLGVHVCEDMWNRPSNTAQARYARDPIAELAADGADVFVNLSASPFATGKRAVRDGLVADITQATGRPFVLVGQTGANTELIFDGDSRVHSADGACRLDATRFEEHLLVWDTEAAHPDTCHRASDDIETLHDALVLGIRDYARKSGFKSALLGLSGGIDSAVTAALAVEALGADHVLGVTMPSRYSSTGSVSDSEALAEALGIRMLTIPIEPAVSAFETMLAEAFEGTEPGVTEENVQSRVRGVALMALSNKFGHLLLSTGNKSEMAVGYATLYGDMNGGLAVLADVFKQEVYALARFMNDRAGRELVPESTITKPPSAELRPDQKDEDSLPPYEVLDRILQLYVERHLGAEQIIAETGFEAEVVREITRLVDRNEYKRRQAAPGLRVTDKAFGSGRRMPIAMRRTRVEPVEAQTP